MKDVPKHDLPRISGGDYEPVGSNPQLPSPGTGLEYPRNPFNPVYEAPSARDE